MDTHRRLSPGLFVAQVTGKAMEPAVPSGSYCLFAAPVTGSRQGRVLLVQLVDANDPDTGWPFTVRRYQSEKVAAGEGAWRHLKVTLEPNNCHFEPIELTCEEEENVRVVAELVEVLG